MVYSEREKVDQNNISKTLVADAPLTSNYLHCIGFVTPHLRLDDNAIQKTSSMGVWSVYYLKFSFITIQTI